MKWFFTFMCFAIALVAPAQERSEPLFSIEKIRVVDFEDPKIIISSSFLVEGESYNEKELNDALHRIKRLPFVFDCNFSLEKGSVRGKYVLRIEVETTRKLSFGLFGISLTERLSQRESFEAIETAGQFSYRLFASRNTLGYVSAGLGHGDNGDGLYYNAGINHYNLFNRNIFANLNIAYLPGNLVQDELKSVVLQFAKPFKNNQWLRLAHSWTEFEIHEFDLIFEDGTLTLFEQGRRQEEVGTALTWEYNTTDDALEPTKGQVLLFSTSYVRSEQTLILNEDPQEETKRDELILALEGEKYWGFSKRRSFSLGGGLANRSFQGDASPSFLVRGTSREEKLLDLDRIRAHLKGTVSKGLLKKRFGYRKNEFRLKLGAALEYNEDPRLITTNIITGESREVKLTQTRALYSIGFSYRAKWGYIDLNLIYDDNLDTTLSEMGVVK